LRGNIAIKVKEEIEAKILQALGEFKSQEKIIAHLVKSRLQRTVRSGYIKVYLKFNPRPSMNYAAYIKKVLEIDETNPSKLML